jgi:hypothetical protein
MNQVPWGEIMKSETKPEFFETKKQELVITTATIYTQLFGGTIDEQKLFASPKLAHDYFFKNIGIPYEVYLQRVKLEFYPPKEVANEIETLEREYPLIKNLNLEDDDIIIEEAIPIIFDAHSL